MSQNPYTSFLTEDAVVDTSFYQKVLVVGQSNDTTAGLYEDIEQKTEEQINALFGSDSHLTSMLKEFNQEFSNSIIKPKVMAVSYQDNGSAVARILELTVSGSATESGYLKINVNANNVDRLVSQGAAIMALRNTKGAYCGAYAQNAVSKGSPNLAGMPFNPLLSDVSTKDIIVEAYVTEGDSATTIAAAIASAINASDEAIYSATSSSGVVTLTCKHKGSIGNFMPVEAVKASIPSGISISVVEDTAGSGVVDASDILDITNDDDVKLSEMDFNLVVIPFSYSNTALVNDAKAKFDNVYNYSNQCLEYWIWRGIAIDTSDSDVIDNLSADEPASASGVVKSVFVAKLHSDGIRIIGVSDTSERKALEAKQFTPIQKNPKDGSYTIGNCYTLSNSVGFKDFPRVFAAMRVREFIVEKMIPVDYPETSYTTGTAELSFQKSKADVIADFERYFAILDGTIKTSEYGSDWAGIISNSEDAKARLSEMLEATFAFDKANYQLFINFINELLNPIKSIQIIANYN